MILGPPKSEGVVPVDLLLLLLLLLILIGVLGLHGLASQLHAGHVIAAPAGTSTEIGIGKLSPFDSQMQLFFIHLIASLI